MDNCETILFPKEEKEKAKKDLTFKLLLKKPFLERGKPETIQECEQQASERVEEYTKKACKKLCPINEKTD